VAQKLDSGEREKIIPFKKRGISIRTLRDVLNIARGVREGKKLAGVQIGGPSGAILSLTGVRAYLLDAPWTSMFSTGWEP
jgi:hypothetical protein